MTFNEPLSTKILGKSAWIQFDKSFDMVFEFDGVKRFEAVAIKLDEDGRLSEFNILNFCGEMLFEGKVLREWASPQTFVVSSVKNTNESLKVISDTNFLIVQGQGFESRFRFLQWSWSLKALFSPPVLKLPGLLVKVRLAGTDIKAECKWMPSADVSEAQLIVILYLIWVNDHYKSSA